MRLLVPAVIGSGADTTRVNVPYAEALGAMRTILGIFNPRHLPGIVHAEAGEKTSYKLRPVPCSYTYGFTPPSFVTTSLLPP